MRMTKVQGREGQGGYLVLMSRHVLNLVRTAAAVHSVMTFLSSAYLGDLCEGNRART